MINTLFSNYANIIVFLHILSAIIWVGGMLIIRYAIHYSIQKIKDPKIKIQTTLENLRRFFNMVIPSILILLITAIILILALGFKGTALYSIVIIKESIWTVMTIIFVTVFIKRKQASKAFLNNDLNLAKEKLRPIANYLIPINIVLGLVAIFLGVTLRGF